MNLYLENGYLDMWAIYNIPRDFIFVYGGRGPGKTYGMFELLAEHRIKFLYLRRTQKQERAAGSSALHPYKILNERRGWNIRPFIVDGVRGFYHAIFDDKDKKYIIDPDNPDALGYITSLSGFASTRGIDGSDIDCIFFDEFVAKRNEKRMPGEFAAVNDVQETINRNRELEGKPPVKMVFCSNTDNIANPVFLGWNLVRRAQKMESRGDEIYIDNKRPFALVSTVNSPISERKSETALYRMDDTGSYSRMAIHSSFGEEYTNIKSMPLTEFRPVMVVGEIAIYHHKSRQYYYISTHISGGCPRYGASEKESDRARKHLYRVWDAYYEGQVIFEEPLCEILLQKYVSGK